jgi:pyruvate kinase
MQNQLQNQSQELSQKRKTKIVCSLGPASCTDEVVRELILAGLNVARLNFSHGTHESHRKTIDCVRRVSTELGIPVAIMLDTKGPEIRTGMVESGDAVIINKDDAVIVTVDECPTAAARTEANIPARLSISWKNAPQKLQSGHSILIADGLLELRVIEVRGEEIHCRAINTASIGSKKNVNLVGVHANLPIMSEQDKKDIAFGMEMDVDFVAASFLSYPHEVTEIKNYLASLNATSNITVPKIIAKIECREGVDNIEEISRLADAVMVARGDLGVQLPTEEIPLVQKHIINICRKTGTPVITATQMLESMIVNLRPTRAELTDVANAVFDGSDAVMLSGETAMGAYPIEAVRTMAKIVHTVEQSDEFRRRMKELTPECFSLIPGGRENFNSVMARSSVEIASALKARLILTPTLSGNTARMLSIYRPDVPVLAVTPDKKTEAIMQLYWGVETCRCPHASDFETMIENSIFTAGKLFHLNSLDKILLVAGLPLDSPSVLNTIRVFVYGD